MRTLGDETAGRKPPAVACPTEEKRVTAVMPATDAIAHLDFSPACEWSGCDRPATWLAYGTCPGCQRGLFKGRSATHYACDREYASWLAALAVDKRMDCGPCGAELRFRDVFTWRRIGRGR